jgi:hypothetical protein
MKKTAFITALGIGLSLSVSASAGMMAFSGPDSVSYAGDLWKALGDAKLVGSPADNPAPYKGVHPHGAVLTTATSEVTVGGHTGKVIVKKNFGGEGVSTGMVASDAAKYLKAVTVMFKREDGYDADNQNWFWAKYKADGSLDTNPKGMKLAGRVAKGKPKGCIACHTAAPGGDYIYTN